MPSPLKKKALTLVGLAILVLFVSAQLVPVSRDNPPVVEEPAWDAPRTRELAKRACFDCHSNETVWPWYAHVAPASWIVSHHVEDARKHLNFSEWHRPQKHAHEAAEELEEGEMPLPAYLPVHAEARLSDEEKQALIAGLKRTLGEEKPH